MAIIKIDGLDALMVALKEKTDSKAVQDIVKKHGSLLQSRTKDNMDSAYVKGYSTGNTARNTNLDLLDGNMTAKVTPDTPYFGYVEYGTRKMAAEPTLGPAFDVQSQEFIKDLKDNAFK